MKYKVDNVKNYSGTRSWICGHFMADDSIQKNSELEVKYSHHLPGDASSSQHSHPRGIEVVIVIKGRMNYQIDGKEYVLSDGDFIFMQSDVKEAILEVYDPTTLVSIRTPSIPNNKVVLSATASK